MEKKFLVVFLATSILCLLPRQGDCQGLSEEEKLSFIDALNQIRREASGNNQLAAWGVFYEEYAANKVEHCLFTPTGERADIGVSEFVSKADSDFLVDAVNTWVSEGKEDEKNGCPNFACNDYHLLISRRLRNIGCAYKHCLSLEGTYVVCKYDFILN